jgi:hypothetical protein
MQLIHVGQNITKDSVVGDRLMNRYAIFNGLEIPRRIDCTFSVQLLGVAAAQIPTTLTPGAGGDLTPETWYAYVAVFASQIHTRPVPNTDGSGNFTRGNPSPELAVQLAAGQNRVTAVIPTTTQAGITHVLLYRSLSAPTQATAENGPFYYVGQAAIAGGATVTIVDDLADESVGEEVETDNYPPNAYRYACAAMGTAFVGGNYPLGSGRLVTMTPGSSLVTLEGPGADTFYDGIVGWRFRVQDDDAAGVDGSGLFFANYVDGHTIQLIDDTGAVFNYNGTHTTGQLFSLYLPGYVLRWCKYGEPEAWPLTNAVDLEGDITGIAQIPNQPLLLVCTDTPSIYVFDLTLLGTDSFKTNKRVISTEYTASSHYSLCAVDGALRGLDAHKSCVWATDGTVVKNISGQFIPRIFQYLTDDLSLIRLWHCAYDSRRRLFGAFVTFRYAQRMVDYCVGQNTLTGGWFFNFEKDLLCTGNYLHPTTGEAMVLGGTEGPGSGRGGIWGRIWCPTIYADWVPDNTLRLGEIVEVLDNTSFRVDVSGGVNLYTVGDGLVGRWVLITDANGEYAQLGYITSNTGNTITVDGVIGGLSATHFDPAPIVGGKFYCGLIEMRWGPKRFDFGDPDMLKKVWEIYCCTHDNDPANPPFVRIYRGFEEGYTRQLALAPHKNLDRTNTNTYSNKVDSKLEPVPRWALAWYDRSYAPTNLHSLTIVLNMVGKKPSDNWKDK